jgi:phage virion morphogenesis protein
MVVATDDLSHLESWVAPLVAKLSASGRRSLSRVIGRDLRALQQKRIAAQLEPDGTPFAARKPRLRANKGKIRKRQAAMFAKLRTARWLKVVATPDAVSVGFTGQAARIARIHQEGLNDRPGPNSRETRYPRRQLLGFSEADREMVRNHFLEHLRD